MNLPFRYQFFIIDPDPELHQLIIYQDVILITPEWLLISLFSHQVKECSISGGIQYVSCVEPNKK